MVETLAATLPRLVSSLVLAVRGELVPLLLYTISRHKVGQGGELVPLLLYTISRLKVGEGESWCPSSSPPSVGIRWVRGGGAGTPPLHHQ